MRTAVWFTAIVMSVPLTAALMVNANKPAQADAVVFRDSQQRDALLPQGNHCLRHDDVNLNLNARLTGPAVRTLLKPEALASGVEVYTTGSEDNKFGNVSIMYWQPKGSCVLWYETISVVEYATRLGLTPYEVSPFYKKESN